MGDGSKRKDARTPAVADGRFSSDQPIFGGVQGLRSKSPFGADNGDLASHGSQADNGDLLDFQDPLPPE